jgi:phytoene desaturase
MEGPAGPVSRIVVVGAGVGGLAAAARLAASGHEVTVCEQAGVTGGKLGWLELPSEAGTFGFDTGPSLITMPHVFAELFRATGSPDDVPTFTRTTLPRPRFADGTRLDPAVTAEDFLAGLDADNRADWSTLMDRAERAWAATNGPFLQRPLHGARTLLGMAMQRPQDIGAVAPMRTLRHMGNRHLRDPRLRQVLDRYATYTGSDPRRAPAALLTVPWVEQHFGAHYLQGGLRLLGDAIRDRALDRGARLILGADVTAIETAAGGRATGVVLADGTRLPADIVVANVDAADLYGRLLPRPGQARRIARAPASYSGVVVLLGVRNAPEDADLCHHEVLFPADYDAEFDGLARGDAPLPDPTIYLSRPDDPATAPRGHAAWFVLVNAPRQGQLDWTAAGVADAYAGRILALMAERGIDVRDRIVTSRILTPADLEQRTRASGGAIYGTSSNGPTAAFLRPANRSEVPGLFLVGGSSHPGGGLPLVTMSAQIVSNLIGPA